MSACGEIDGMGCAVGLIVCGRIVGCGGVWEWLGKVGLILCRGIGWAWWEWLRAVGLIASGGIDCAGWD